MGVTGRKKYRRIVAVDFEGTLAVTRFPRIIKPIPEVIRKVKKMKKKGMILILWTSREGMELADAVEWCKEQGIEFDYINENVPEVVKNFGGNDSRKIWAHEYIDDKAVNPGLKRKWARRMRAAYIGQGIRDVVYMLMGCGLGVAAYYLIANQLF